MQQYFSPWYLYTEQIKVHNNQIANCKQSFRINNSYGDFENIIAGVQGSILGPILFSLSINDSFFFIFIASAHNFVMLSTFAENFSKLINILQSKSEVKMTGSRKNK